MGSSSGIQLGDAVMNFTANTQGLEQLLTELPAKSQQAAEKAVSSVVSTFGRVDSAVQESTNKQGDAASSAAQRISKAYESLGVTSRDQFNKTMLAAQAAYRTIEQSGTATATELAAAALRVAETEGQMRRAMGESIPVALENRIESLRVHYAELTGTLDKYIAEQTKANDVGSKGSKTATPSSGNGVGSALLGSIGLAGGIAGAAATGGAMAVGAITNALHDGTTAALDFEQAFAQLTTLIDTKTPEGTKDVAMLRAQLMEIPPAMGDIVSLTRAAYEALSSDVPAAQVAALTKSVAAFGTAAHTDLFTSMDLMTTVLNAYGIQVDKADNVTSALFKTIDKGKLEGPELASNLGRVIPVAAAMQVNLNELLAALAAMTKGGLSLDEAVTSVRQALVSLQSPSAEAQKAAKQLGINLAEIRGEIRDKGLNVALGELAEKTRGNTTATAEMFGNVRALVGVLALTGAQAGSYKEFLGDITKAYKDANEAGEALDKVMSSQKGQLDILSNTIKNTFVQSWETLKPVIDSTAGSLKTILVDGGLLIPLIIAIVGGLLTLETTLSAVAIIIKGFESGVYAMAAAFARVLSLVPGVSEKLQAAGNSYAQLKAKADEAAKAATGHVDATKKSYEAVNDLLHGINGAAAAHDAYAQAAKRKADADSAAAAATRRAAEESDRIKQKLADEKAAAEAAAAATKKYADAHGIAMVGELEKNVAEARQFYSLMVATNQPMGTQLQAMLNLNRAQQALNGSLRDARTIGQAVREMFTKKNEQVPLEPVQLPVQLKMDENTGLLVKQENVLVDEAVEKWKALLQAEQDMGITGSATLAKQVTDMEQYIETLKRNGATQETIVQAQLKLVDANRRLEDSFSPLAQEIERVRSAEQFLGIEGARALRQGTDQAKLAMAELQAAYEKGLIGPQELAKAQLAVLESDMALKLQMGKPIPESMVQQYSRLTAAINNDKRALQDHLTVSERWFELWHGRGFSTAQAMQKVADIGKTAFMDLTQATESAVAAAILGQKGFGEAMQEATASALASVAGQAAVLTLFETAKAFASLAVWDFASATAHFKSAGIFAVTAAIAGAGGALINPSSGSSTSSSGSASSSTSTLPTTATVAAGPVRSTNVQRFATGGLITTPTMAMIGDSKKDPTKGAAEAAIPLEDPQAMQTVGTALANALAANGGAGDTHVYHIQGWVSDKTMDQLIDKMNGRVRNGKTLHASTAKRTVTTTGS